MQNSEFKQIKSAEIVSISFALVILISLFSAFSSRQAAVPLEIIALVILGVAYITNGIYGFQFAAREEHLADRIIYFLLQLVIGSVFYYFEKPTLFKSSYSCP